MRTETYSDIKR